MPKSLRTAPGNPDALRFAATDADGRDLSLVYAFAEAEDAGASEFGPDVAPDS